MTKESYRRAAWAFLIAFGVMTTGLLLLVVSAVSRRDWASAGYFSIAGAIAFVGGVLDTLAVVRDHNA